MVHKAWHDDLWCTVHPSIQSASSGSCTSRVRSWAKQWNIIGMCRNSSTHPHTHTHTHAADKQINSHRCHDWMSGQMRTHRPTAPQTGQSNIIEFMNLKRWNGRRPFHLHDDCSAHPLSLPASGANREGNRKQRKVFSQQGEYWIGDSRFFNQSKAG